MEKSKNFVKARADNYNSITTKAIGMLPAYKNYREKYKFLQQSQWWDKEKLEEYQLSKLDQLLNHSYKNVPYYRKVFEKLGLKPKDIQDFSDLKKLPFLTKEIIRDNLDDLKPRNYPNRKFEYVTTGGSTGIPLGIFYGRGVSRAIEAAFMKILWERVGFKYTDKCVILRGHVINSENDGKFWRKALLGRWLLLSSYFMTEENLPKYVKKIRDFKPKFVQAYPSAISILARFMEDRNLKCFSSIKSILCGSENLYPSQRKLLEEVFQCRVYSWYGHAEQAVLAGECEISSNYHIFPEYGIVELIDKNERVINNNNAMGEVVATGLNNFYCPLIRYKTKDMAVLSNEKCACGREYPLLKNIEGRLQEMIITESGRMISMTAINMHSDVFDNVIQFQFHQYKKSEVILNIVRKDNYSDKDTKYIFNEVSKKLGSDIKLDIQFVDNIPRTSRGKYRFLIQELPVAFDNYEK